MFQYSSLNEVWIVIDLSKCLENNTKDNSLACIIDSKSSIFKTNNYSAHSLLKCLTKIEFKVKDFTWKIPMMHLQNGRTV